MTRLDEIREKLEEAGCSECCCEGTIPKADTEWLVGELTLSMEANLRLSTRNAELVEECQKWQKLYKRTKGRHR